MQVQTTEKELQKGHNKNFIEVALITTAGSYPKEGFETEPVHQKIIVFIKKAVAKLHIVSTDKWVAKVGTTVLNLENSYLENGLSGKVEIDYGPEDGGGGKQ